MKKVRSDSKIMALPENQQLQLAEWLLDGNSYETAQTRLETQFGVKVGLAALSQFWHTMCVPEFLARRAELGKTLLAQKTDEKDYIPADKMDAACLNLVKQRALELATRPQASVSDLTLLYRILNEGRAFYHKNRQLNLKTEQYGLQTAKLALRELKNLRGLASDPNDPALGAFFRLRGMLENNAKLEED